MSFQTMAQSSQFKKLIIGLFFLISFFLWFGFYLYGQYYVGTDNAYVNANVVQISARITGKVTQLFVKNNQYVKQGEPLFSLDKEPFQLAVNSARAELALSMAELDKATHAQERVLNLVKKRFLSQQDGDNSVANYKTALAKVEQAKAHLSQAELNLQYANVRAPASGWVTNVSLNTGDSVSENQSLFALISDKEFWVDANFKETELRAIRAGQLADISTDMYPKHVFKGVVESISGGSGSVFSLLPSQNATGNWVKVTQRVPVRIRVLDPTPHYPLRIGTSAEVKVRLKSYQS